MVVYKTVLRPLMTCIAVVALVSCSGASEFEGSAKRGTGKELDKKPGTPTKDEPAVTSSESTSEDLKVDPDAGSIDEPVMVGGIYLVQSHFPNHSSAEQAAVAIRIQDKSGPYAAGKKLDETLVVELSDDGRPTLKPTIENPKSDMTDYNGYYMVPVEYVPTGRVKVTVGGKEVFTEDLAKIVALPEPEPDPAPELPTIAVDHFWASSAAQEVKNEYLDVEAFCEPNPATTSYSYRMAVESSYVELIRLSRDLIDQTSDKNKPEITIAARKWALDPATFCTRPFFTDVEHYLPRTYAAEGNGCFHFLVQNKTQNGAWMVAIVRKDELQGLTIEDALQVASSPALTCDSRD